MLETTGKAATEPNLLTFLMDEESRDAFRSAP